MGRLTAEAQGKERKEGQGGKTEVTGKAIKLAVPALDASGVEGGGTTASAATSKAAAAAGRRH